MKTVCFHRLFFMEKYAIHIPWGSLFFSEKSCIIKY